eukprot:scaffold76777_cov63-Phaeocystis_antarctica.AAC.2
MESKAERELWAEARGQIVDDALPLARRDRSEGQPLNLLKVRAAPVQYALVAFGIHDARRAAIRSGGAARMRGRVIGDGCCWVPRPRQVLQPCHQLGRESTAIAESHHVGLPGHEIEMHIVARRSKRATRAAEADGLESRAVGLAHRPRSWRFASKGNFVELAGCRGRQEVGIAGRGTEVSRSRVEPPAIEVAWLAGSAWRARCLNTSGRGA